MRDRQDQPALLGEDARRVRHWRPPPRCGCAAGAAAGPAWRGGSRRRMRRCCRSRRRASLGAATLPTYTLSIVARCRPSSVISLEARTMFSKCPSLRAFP